MNKSREESPELAKFNLNFFYKKSSFFDKINWIFSNFGHILHKNFDENKEFIMDKLEFGEEFYSILEKHISKERLENYGAKDNASEQIKLARYLKNIAISQSLYLSLHFFEIIFRNKINDAFIMLYSNEAWYETVTLHLYSENMLKKAIKKLTEHKKHYNNGDVISALCFGFWTSLFDKNNEQHQFQSFICKNIFSNCTQEQRKTQDIYKKVEKIRILRNRVFHYERIIHWKDLQDQHNQILLLIKYMDQDLYEMIISMDRFDDIYNCPLTKWIDLHAEYLNNHKTTNKH
jgi:hypothetical protein